MFYYIIIYVIWCLFFTICFMKFLEIMFPSKKTQYNHINESYFSNYDKKLRSHKRNVELTFPRSVLTTTVDLKYIILEYFHANNIRTAVALKQPFKSNRDIV